MSNKSAKPIYVASRASVPARPQMWQSLRAQGWPISSTWIDEAGEGETGDFSELWQRIHDEISASCGVILYAEESDFPLKGAYIECGMALGMGKPVAVVLKFPLMDRSMRPLGSWANHPLVKLCQSLEQARNYVQSATTQPREQAAPDSNNPDKLAALLCCLYEGPEIQLAATMLIEQAMELEELRAAPVAAPEAIEVESLRASNAKLLTSMQKIMDVFRDSLEPPSLVTGEMYRIASASTLPVAVAEAPASVRKITEQLHAAISRYCPEAQARLALMSEVGRIVDNILPAATTASQSEADKLLAMRAEYDRKEGEARGTMMGGATTASASDGSIYESVSRCADPEGHAEALAQIDEVLGRATAPSRNAAPLEQALYEAWCVRKGYSTNKWHDGGYVDSNTQNGWEVWQGRAALTQQSAAQAPEQGEPDMLWLTEDPEVFANGPDDFAADYADNCLMLGEQAEVVVDCAYRGSKRTMRIAVAKEEDAENRVSWEWVAALAATEKKEPRNG